MGFKVLRICLLYLSLLPFCTQTLGSLLHHNQVIKPIPEHCGRGLHHDYHQDEFGSRPKRIVGGHTSKFGEWPWLVSMRLRNETRSAAKGKDVFDHLCGGTLIHAQWVVTAAHCFEKVWADFLSDDPKDWMVRIGEHDMFVDQRNHVELRPIKILFHSKRNAPKEINRDIALIKLERPVRLQEHINVLCLPRVDDVFGPGKTCITAGWGHTVESGNVSNILRHVRLPIISNEQCEQYYRAMPDFDMSISTDMLCAGYGHGGKDACQYDSGGPMVCFDWEDNQWLLAGIVSTGYGCARAGFPGIYTRVSSFIPFIEETIAFN